MSGIKLSSSKLTKNLVRRTKLVQHLDSAFARFDEKFEFEMTPKERDDAFHPSSHCMPNVYDLWCVADDFFMGRDPDPISGGLRKIFLVGHFWHAILQHLLVNDLEFADPEAIERQGSRITYGELRGMIMPDKGEAIPYGNPFCWARGSADVAPCRIPRHGEWLVDFKTMNSMSFARNDAPAGFVEKWECQVNIYMDWFDLEKALIVGINKDNGDFREFEFIRNQPLIDAIYKKWELVGICLDDDDVPHPDEDPNVEQYLLGPVMT